LLSLLLSAAFLPGRSIAALTLEDLHADAELTPEKLLAHFSDFKFQIRDEVQKPEAFLASRCGDCDDFATLAASLLSTRGYTPRLVAVFMDKEVHVVCYIVQTNNYLDYNRRKDRTLISSTGALDDIAEKVARSFRSTWHSVSEFTFDGNARQFVRTEFR
jgi:hypothetical protein